MVHEAYVSFETAKLLKEKGFDIHCDRGWDISCYDVKQSRMFSYGFDSKENWISSPTHQMAMKWLREECEVYIDIETCYEYTNRNENFKVTGFAFTTHTKDDPCYDDDNSFDSYEEACEAALKHVLENLI